MKKMRYDLLLIAVVLLTAALLWFVTAPGGEGAWVIVICDGQEMGRYPLAEDLTVTFGDGAYNILEISGGSARVIEANCGDHTCVRTGEISREGQSIVCLPHKLIVTIAGGEADSFDAVTK